MRETIEVRIPERHAARHLPQGVGDVLGETVRKIQFDRSDPLFFKIGQLEREFRARGSGFFTYAHAHRRYSTRELKAADLFHVWPKRTFEPAGEECGTKYDESTACPKCGSGAFLTSGLILDMRKTPQKADIAETIAGERIISQKFAECVIDSDLKGIVLKPVKHKARYEDDPIDLAVVPTGREILRKAKVEGAEHPTWSFWVWLNRAENRDMLDQASDEYVTMKRQSRRRRQSLPTWYQLVVTSSPVEIGPPTRAGSDPFDEDSHGRCPRCDLLGLNLLSEVTVKKNSVPEADAMETKQMVGVRRGLLRPRPLLLVTARAWRAFEAAKLRGLTVEVAHIS